MSADREIASQMVEMTSPERSDSSTAFPRKRYPQRLRRRSTELFQFTQIEPFSDVAEEPVTVPNEGYRLESGVPTAGNETGAFISHLQIIGCSVPILLELLIGQSVRLCLTIL